MRRIAYGLGFVGILILTNIIRYKQEHIIDQVFALDSIHQDDRFMPNVSFQGLIFLEQLLVCTVAYLIIIVTDAYHTARNPYEQVHPVGADKHMTSLYQSVETIQQQREKHSLNFIKTQTNNSNCNQYALQQQQSITQIPQQPAKPHIPLQYSLALGVIYFISLKSFAQVQTKFNITVAVGFKGLNLIFFVMHSCMNRVQIPIPFTKIYLTFGKGTMSGLYGFVLTVMVGWSSIAYFAIDDLFRIAMVDSNKSLGLIFDASAVGIYFANIGLEHVTLGLLFTVKQRYSGAGSIPLVVSLLQFSCVCFGINLIYNGTLISTLSVIYKYPDSSWVLSQLCIVGLCQYLTFSYTLINYPMTVVVTMISSRPCLKYIQKHLVDEPSMLGALYGVIAVGTVLYVVELVRLYGEIHQKSGGKQSIAAINMEGEYKGLWIEDRQLKNMLILIAKK